MSDHIKRGVALVDQALGSVKASIGEMKALGCSIDPADVPELLTGFAAVAESALNVALGRLQGKSEPYPGAAEQVVQQCLDHIDLLRRAGVLPERKKP